MENQPSPKKKALTRFEKQLSDRPILVMVSVLFMFSVLVFKFFLRLSNFNCQFRHLHDVDDYTGLTLPFIFAIIFGVMVIIGIWRLRSVNKALKQKLFSLLRSKPSITEQQRQQIRAEMNAKFKTKENTFKKARVISQIGAISFAGAVLLMGICFLTLLAQQYKCSGGPECVADFNHHLHFYHFWVIVMSLIFYMIFNDIYIGGKLEEILMELIKKVIPDPIPGPIPDPMLGWDDFDPEIYLSLIPEFIEKFKPRKEDLIARPKEVFQLKHEQGKTNREIAELFSKEETTIDTHVNNLNRNWKKFLKEKGLNHIDLRELYQQKKPEDDQPL